MLPLTVTHLVFACGLNEGCQSHANEKLRNQVSEQIEILKYKR